MTESKVSIVLPIYNVEYFLSESIDSIIKQTYKNIEILLIDDGATDNSGLIADEYAKKDIRIKVYHKINGGLSDTRNYGLAKATGDYIFFPDSDDYLEPQLVEEAIKQLTATNGDIFCFNYNLVNENGESASEGRKRGAKNEILDAKSAIELILSNQLNNYIWQFVYRRELLKKMDFQFLKGVLYEDIVATPEIMWAANKIVFSSQHLYNYRIRENSIVHRLSLKKVQDIEFVVRQFIDFTENNQIGNQQLRNQFKLPLFMTAYIGMIKFPNEVSKEHLKNLQREIIASKQTNMSLKEQIKYYLIKTNLIKLIK